MRIETYTEAKVEQLGPKDPKEGTIPVVLITSGLGGASDTLTIHVAQDQTEQFTRFFGENIKITLTFESEEDDAEPNPPQESKQSKRYRLRDVDSVCAHLQRHGVSSFPSWGTIANNVEALPKVVSGLDELRADGYRWMHSDAFSCYYERIAEESEAPKRYRLRASQEIKRRRFPKRSAGVEGVISLLPRTANGFDDIPRGLISSHAFDDYYEPIPDEGDALESCSPIRAALEEAVRSFDREVDPKDGGIFNTAGFQQALKRTTGEWMPGALISEAILSSRRADVTAATEGRDSHWRLLPRNVVLAEDDILDPSDAMIEVARTLRSRGKEKQTLEDRQEDHPTTKAARQTHYLTKICDVLRCSFAEAPDEVALERQRRMKAENDVVDLQKEMRQLKAEGSHNNQSTKLYRLRALEEVQQRVRDKIGRSNDLAVKHVWEGMSTCVTGPTEARLMEGFFSCYYEPVDIDQQMEWVRRDEREACARIADTEVSVCSDRIAKHIRARGEEKSFEELGEELAEEAAEHAETAVKRREYALRTSSCPVCRGIIRIIDVPTSYGMKKHEAECHNCKYKTWRGINDRREG